MSRIDDPRETHRGQDVISPALIPNSPAWLEDRRREIETLLRQSGIVLIELQRRQAGLSASAGMPEMCGVALTNRPSHACILNAGHAVNTHTNGGMLWTTAGPNLDRLPPFDSPPIHEHRYEPHEFAALGAVTYCPGCGDTKWPKPTDSEAAESRLTAALAELSKARADLGAIDERLDRAGIYHPSVVTRVDDLADQLAFAGEAHEELMTAATDQFRRASEAAAAKNAELRDEVRRLSDLAGRVLGHFVHQGHPGYDARQTGWIRVDTLESWREESKARV